MSRSLYLLYCLTRVCRHVVVVVFFFLLLFVMLLLINDRFGAGFMFFIQIAAEPSASSLLSLPALLVSTVVNGLCVNVYKYIFLYVSLS